MALTVLMIIVFGIAIIIPATWSIIGLIRGNTSFWPGVVGTAFAVILLVVTFVGIGTNWGGCPKPGEPTGSSKGAVKCATGDTYAPCEPDVWRLECRQAPGCTGISPGEFCPKGQKPVFPFCEHIQTGGVKQPWATWSDLSFVAAGLWLMWFFQYFGSPGSTLGTRDNPMVTIGLLSITYGLIVIFMGPPSQWFHASMKEWGGWFDSMSVVAWLMFNAVYVIYTLAAAMWGNGRGMRPLAVLIIWGALIVICGLIGMNDDARLYLYFAGGVPWGIAEVIYLIVGLKSSNVKYRRTWWLFVINFVLLAVTMLIWVFFNPEVTPLTPPTACQAREAFPGHALFHILASFATILTFASFASEREV
ncbi:MAG TPA: hypothetical protein VGJ66_13215 [Pyrinomonadaceae bacterium]|jgi:hypothetical protein